MDSLTLVIASANTFPRLTANALVDAEKAVKRQLQDWLEKPQSHEQLAVRGIASQRGAKTKTFDDGTGNDPRRAFPAGESSSLVKGETDMSDRLEKLQGPEWLAAGNGASPVGTETKATPEQNGEDLPHRVLVVGITTKEENHLEDRSDKPAKHELLVSKGCGSHAPAKTDEFFADIDEILGGKTE